MIMCCLTCLEVSHEEEKKSEAVAAAETKPRAKRVDWSPEDKVAFFEALNEFGKDIDAIHNYLVQKAKRRGGLEVKTKDQVRFFYYRMSSILIKHISFPTCKSGAFIYFHLEYFHIMDF